MTYSFNQQYRPIDANVLADIFPTGALPPVQAIINSVTSSIQNPTEKDVLQALVSDAFSSSPTISVTDVYRYVFAEISEYNNLFGKVVPSSALAQADKSSWLWVQGAIQVNADDGSFFSEFIRDYTSEQYQMRYGTILANSEIQQASDKIAQQFVNDILNVSGQNPSNNLPDINTIGQHDAGEIASEIFDQHPVDGAGNYAPWAGTILFPFLGQGFNSSNPSDTSATFLSQWVLDTGTNANKKIAGTYDLVSIAAATHNITGFIDGLANAITLGGIMNDNNIGFLATAGLLQDLRVEANSFFSSVYAISPSINHFRIGDFLPLYSPVDLLNTLTFQFAPNFVLGSLYDDVGIHNLITTEAMSVLNPLGHDIAHAGLGNDVIKGSTGSDLIDGGAGYDTLDYLPVTESVIASVEKISSEYFDYRLVVEDASILSSFTDYAYDIEELKLTNYADTVNINTQYFTNDVVFDAGADINGSDILSLGYGNYTLRGDGADDFVLLSDSGGTYTFRNFEEIYSTGKVTLLDDTSASKNYAGIGSNVIVDYSTATSSGSISGGQGQPHYMSIGGVTDNVSALYGLRGTQNGDTFNLDYGFYVPGRDLDLYTGAGDDTLTMGAGIGMLHGPSLTIHYRGGNDSYDLVSGFDEIYLNSTIRMSDISVQVLGGGLAHSVNRVTIAGHGTIDIDARDFLDISYTYKPVKLILESGGEIHIHPETWPSGQAVTFANRVEYFGTSFALNEHTGTWGIDNWTGRAGEDETYYALDGDDVLQGGDGSDTIYGGEGYDTATFALASTSYNFAKGDDYVSVILSGATTEIDRFYDVESFVFTDTTLSLQDILNMAEFDTTIQSYITGTNGDDTLFTTSNNLNEEFSGLAGDDYISAGGGNDHLIGGDGNDTLLAGGNINLFEGGSGGDGMGAGSGNDTLIGGLHYDFVEGGGGDDTYIYRLGDSSSQASGSNYTEEYARENIGNGVDTVRIEGVNSEDARIWRDGTGDYFIKYSPTDQIKLNSYGIYDGSYSSHFEYIEFDDGTVWDIGSAVYIYDTDSGHSYIGGDALRGAITDDYIDGQGGDDDVFGSGGNDHILGGDGNDILRGDGDLFGVAGNDILEGQAGNDVLIGGDGDDIYYGGTGDDTIGELANEGFDKAFYNGSYADYTIIAQPYGGNPAGRYQVTDNVGTDGVDLVHAEVEQIIFADGIFENGTFTPNNQLFTGTAAVETFTGGAGFDSVDYVNSSAGVTVNLTSGVNTGGYADGDTLVSIEAVQGSDYDDSIRGDAKDNTLEGLIGNDTIHGNYGSDMVIGGSGEDKLYGGAGADTIYGGDDSDIIHGHGITEAQVQAITTQFPGSVFNADLQSFYFVVPAALLPNDWLNAQSIAASFVFEGVAGHLANVTSLEEHQYMVQLAAGEAMWLGGQDYFVEGQWSWFAGNEVGAIFYDTNLTTLNAYENFFGGSPIFATTQSATNTDGLIMLDPYGWGDYDMATPLGFIAEWEATAMHDDDASDTLYGGSGDDVIYGHGGDDFLYGDDDNDILYGGRGEDRLVGGTGDDTLYGQQGDDVLIGGLGADILRGALGADTYTYESGTTFGSVDQIIGFSLAENDALDISDLLVGYNPITDAITDFVQITDNGTDSFLAVDADGGANNFVQVAALLSVTGLTDEDALETSGHLITV